MNKLLRRPARLFIIVSAILVCYSVFHLLPARDSTAGTKTSTVRLEYVKSSFDWSTVAEKNPVPASSRRSLPKGTPKKLPGVQHRFRADKTSAGKARRQILADRRDEVRNAFIKSWKSYRLYAWMSDEVAPVSGARKDPFGGWAATLVDSLDSLWIMDLKDEFYEAVAATARIDWSETKETACNWFETTIRHLGGLLSGYDLSREPALLRKAVELGDMLYTAFDTPTRMPPFWLDFELAKAGQLRAGTHDPAASTTSSTLEFTRLAQLTGENKYYDAVDRVTEMLDRTQNASRVPGMWPTFLDLRRFEFAREDGFTLGALADSMYEMFPKAYALLGGLEPVYEKLYNDAMEAVIAHVLFRPMLPDETDVLIPGNVWVRGSGKIELQPEAQHLACFVGGMFGLGGKLFNQPDHVEIGEKITRGCVWAYDAMPSGMMPEICSFVPCSPGETCSWKGDAFLGDRGQPLPKGFEQARDPRYILRPEAIESVFYMYRITGKEEYQEMAWRMFQSIRKATETELAFSAIADVTVDASETEKTDSMESFWLAETLKYFYLIFSPPDLISLDEYVFNTEAHPFRRP
ncbi:family 47 glycosyl hydrolase [Xylaria bambusicola]|uniref:family 47 glycosyl hydrolase n=1 Tax=Xylaria bambusicola TaxID=326684 RepID=UPI002008959C|nr:family 47 glycosyl hydrolase [Xylaria bambusicola]KAI0521033.1 family 47 glycosyl hydrolase [Xylaria bambusicola]